MRRGRRRRPVHQRRADLETQPPRRPAAARQPSDVQGLAVERVTLMDTGPGVIAGLQPSTVTRLAAAACLRQEPTEWYCPGHDKGRATADTPIHDGVAAIFSVNRRELGSRCDDVGGAVQAPTGQSGIEVGAREPFRGMRRRPISDGRRRAAGNRPRHQMWTGQGRPPNRLASEAQEGKHRVSGRSFQAPSRPIGRRWSSCSAARTGRRRGRTSPVLLQPDQLRCGWNRLSPMTGNGWKCQPR